MAVLTCRTLTQRFNFFWVLAFIVTALCRPMIKSSCCAQIPSVLSCYADTLVFSKTYNIKQYRKHVKLMHITSDILLNENLKLELK